MKKHLINNLFISGLLLSVLVPVACFLKYNFWVFYFMVIPFLFFAYILQSVLLFKLGTTPQKFLMIYNFTTILKMMISIVFLIACYVSLQESASLSDKIYFSLFFILSYFLFLIINTKSFFTKNDEPRQKKSI